jgi:hypothetical protein
MRLDDLWASLFRASSPPAPGLTASSCSYGRRFASRFFQLRLAATPCGSATVAVIGPDWLLSSNKIPPMLGTPCGRVVLGLLACLPALRTFGCGSAALWGRPPGLRMGVKVCGVGRKILETRFQPSTTRCGLRRLILTPMPGLRGSPWTRSSVKESRGLPRAKSRPGADCGRGRPPHNSCRCSVTGKVCGRHGALLPAASQFIATLFE